MFNTRSSTSTIKHLTYKDFYKGEPLLTDQKPMLVFFYVPWCGHCKRAKPEIKKLASMMPSDVTLAALDGEQYPNTAEEVGIQGYPTLILYNPATKEAHEFSGNERKADAILAWVKRGIHTPDEHPNLLELTPSTLKQMQLSNTPLLVMFHSPTCGHCKEAKPTWAAVAANMGGLVKVATFNCESHLETCRALNISVVPTYMFFFKGRAFEYKNKTLSLEGILKFTCKITGRC